MARKRRRRRKSRQRGLNDERRGLRSNDATAQAVRDLVVRERIFFFVVVVKFSSLLFALLCSCVIWD
jgi:hypothetical protein